jgi:hypothetical protein
MELIRFQSQENIYLSEEKNQKSLEKHVSNDWEIHVTLKLIPLAKAIYLKKIQ